MVIEIRIVYGDVNEVQERNNNKIIKTKLFIYTVQTDGDKKLKNMVFERNFVVGTFIPRTDAIIEKGNTVMCDLLLLNPTFFEMDTTYSYNKILNSMTPYDALQDYEDYISKTYGDNFKSKHILNKKNEFKYEQIITQPTDQEIKLPNRSNFTYLCKHDIDIILRYFQ